MGQHCRDCQSVLLLKERLETGGGNLLVPIALLATRSALVARCRPVAPQFFLPALNAGARLAVARALDLVFLSRFGALSFLVARFTGVVGPTIGCSYDTF